MKKFKLDSVEYGYLNPYIIAEIGVNHEGDIERAKNLIKAAAKSGAHAAKFQSYKADLLATRDNSPSYWDLEEESAKSQHELFQRWDCFEDSDYRDLAETCREQGVDFLSTPFDLSSVDLIAELCPAIKIASADITNIPLLRKIGGVQLPVILSLGAARFDEAANAINELIFSGSTEITLLHCVLNYPTARDDAQLSQIKEQERLFGSDCAIGYSDHVIPDKDGIMPALEMAAMLGATVIEKHFTDNKEARGNDHYHAMNAKDLMSFTKRLKVMRELYGVRTRDLTGQQQAINNARRRMVAAKDLEAGKTIDNDDLVALRSNIGVEIVHWDRVIGRKLTRPITNGTPLEWADIK